MSLNFEVSDIINEPEYSSFLIKSKVGRQITQPVSSNFEAMLDSSKIYNISINPYPSAYSYFEGNNFNIVAEVNNCGNLYFEISNFGGTGIYDLTSSFAQYFQGCSDAIATQ